MSQVQQSAAPTAPNLGDVLIQQGVLTAERLQQAEAVRSMNGTSLGKTLVEMQMASEEQIVAAVSVQIGLPFAEVRPGTVDPVAAALLPRDVATELVALPIRFDDDESLLVAVADPGNTASLKQITAITGLKVAPALAVRANLMQAIEHLADASRDGTITLPVAADSASEAPAAAPAAVAAAPAAAASLPERTLPSPEAGEVDSPGGGLLSRDRGALEDFVNGHTAGAEDEQPLPVNRLVDTRHSDSRAPDGTVVIDVSDNAAASEGIVANLTITGAAMSGYATVYPCSSDRTDTSNINFGQGAAIANAVIVEPDVDGLICVFTSIDAEVILDLMATTGSGFDGIVAVREADSRRGPSRSD